MTIDPAFASFTEDILGSLERGKRADLTILSQDIMTTPADTILDTRVLATVIDGKTIFGRLWLAGLGARGPLRNGPGTSNQLFPFFSEISSSKVFHSYFFYCPLVMFQQIYQTDKRMGRVRGSTTLISLRMLVVRWTFPGVHVDVLDTSFTLAQHGVRSLSSGL